MARLPDLEQERQRLQGIHDHATEAYCEAELALGRHAESVPELERMVAEQPLHENLWAMLALAQYRCGRQGEALDALRRTRAVLAEELGVDPGVRLRELERRILAQDPALDLDPRPRSAQPPALTESSVEACPYKGLARYEMEDADSFRGREHLVRTLVTALVDHRLIVVSGSSGAGKSSVVRAGLLPALGAGAVPGSERWRPLIVVPGPRAVDSLAAVSGVEESEPTVLVCDQLEQLWSPDTLPGERVAFLDTVLGLLEDDVVTRVVLVVRGDHLGRLAEHADLAQRMLGGLVMVPPMTEVELRQVVAEPAQAAGLTVEPDLSDVAVRDVLGRSGALPLLSTALAQTWLHRRDGVLTLAGYLASGGVTGAVGRSAELVYDSLTDEERHQARRILVRLAEQDEEGTVRARQLPVAELATGTDPELTERVVERFVASRLLSRDGGHLEVAHEALLTAWPRLSTWLEEDAVGRAVRRHLAPAALEWAAHGRPADELYRGARLQAAAQWVETPGSAPTELERVYVDAGLAQAEAELTAARDRAAAEAAGRRRTRRFATMLAGALVLALVAVGIAVLFQRRADDQAAAARTASTVADANRLAALSSSARSLDVSLLLAAAAVQTADTPATRDSLLNALVGHRRATGVHALSADGVDETALSADGRTMAIAIGRGSPRVLAWQPGSSASPHPIATSWTVEDLAVSPHGDIVVGALAYQPDGVAQLRAYTIDGEQLLSLHGKRALGGYPGDVAFTDDGRLLMFVSEMAGRPSGLRGRLVQVDPTSGTLTTLRTFGRSEPGDATAYFQASFTDDTSAVVAWTDDQTRAYRVTLPDGRPVRLRLAPRPATSLEFVATPTGALQLWSDGAVTRYDARGRPVQGLDVHRAPVRDAAVLPDGRAAVTAGDSGQVELWSVDPRTGDWSLPETLTGHAGAVQQVEVAAGGGALLTAAQDGQLLTWDLTGEAGFGTSYPGLTGRWVSNRIDVVDPGRLIVAPTRTPVRSSDDETGRAAGRPVGTASVAAVFIDPRTGRVVDEVRVGTTDIATVGNIWGSSVAVSPDRGSVAVTSTYAVTVLDTQTGEQVVRFPFPLGRSLRVWSVEWSPDGSKLLLGTEGDGHGDVVVVDTDTWRVVRRIHSHGGSVQVFEWAADGRTLAAGVNYTGAIDLYDSDLRHLRRVELGEGGDVYDLAFSPDGTMLAAARGGGGVTVVDTGTWQPVHETAIMHGDFALDVEWLPDSNTIVSAGADESASLYDVRRDLVRAQALPATDVRSHGATFLLPEPNDELVIFSEGAGRRYPLDPAQWLAQACTVAGRDLTQAEWAKYLPDRPYRPVCGNLDQQSSPR